MRQGRAQLVRLPAMPRHAMQPHPPWARTIHAREPIASMPPSSSATSFRRGHRHLTRPAFTSRRVAVPREHPACESRIPMAQMMPVTDLCARHHNRSTEGWSPVPSLIGVWPGPDLCSSCRDTQLERHPRSLKLSSSRRWTSEGNVAVSCLGIVPSEAVVEGASTWDAPAEEEPHGNR